MAGQQADANHLPVEWQRWAAVAIMRGTQLTEVLETLDSQGFAEKDAVLFCASLFDNPVADAGRWLAQQLEKTFSVLTMRERMRALSDIPIDIDRRAELSRKEFLDRYYSQNQPVLMTDVCDRWPARSLWTPAYLAEKLGSVEVEVMAGRESDSDYEVNANEHRFLMPFDEYVAKVESASRSNDTYLVANNKLLSADAALPLWDDFGLDERYLRPERDGSRAFLWFGPAGTVTPLHHDTMNVLFNQVDGWKHIILIPSLEIHRVYNDHGVYSDVDPRNPDLDRYPMFADVRQIHLDVGPGQTLFIPAGWWHHVEAMEVSISISLTNFVFPNDLQWNNPSFKL
ncbi:MAG TPA: cupin-like domain-containing protein [Streptosporangiaceae bacterium]|nr:cupin-like domain-containing protein [Streptosporangiaceae bacterium]